MTKTLVIKNLNMQHLGDVLNLQKTIIEGLDETEQHFILHRNEQDYIKALTTPGSHMLGVFDGEEMIAQTVYGLPENGMPRDMPEFKPEALNSDLLYYEAILVNPAYRGSSLMKQMLDFIEKQAAEAGRKTSIIQIAVDNPASWINALHQGMVIAKAALDPVDGVKVVYLEKNIDKNNQNKEVFSSKDDEYTLFLGDNIHRKIPALFPKMQYLIEQGFYGVKLDKEIKSLIWQKQVNLTENIKHNTLPVQKMMDCVRNNLIDY